jgi:hypothetical protein
MLWGRLADSEYGGRKAVLMIGLLCSGISLILLADENSQSQVSHISDMDYQEASSLR